MPYLFVWLYLIKCVFTCSIFVDSNTKRFLSVLVVFWKVFCFCKNVKNFKNSVALFWRLNRGLIQSHVPVASPHKDFSQLTGGSMPQSQKILRIFFKIWVFNISRDSVWRFVRRWKVQSRGDLEIFVAYLATLSRVELCEKHLNKFFKIFFLSVLATSPGDLLVTWLNRKNRVFCAYKSVFPSNISDCSLSSPFQTSLKLTVSLSKNLHFCIFNLQISKKKVWVFLSSIYISCF